MKRLLLALILAAALSACPACGTAGDDPSQITSKNDGNTELPAETSDDSLRDNLPAGLDLDGAEVTFLYREEVAGEFFAEALDGELINDTIYNSHINTETRLNVQIEVILMPGHYVESRQGYMNSIINAVNADDDLYDWVDLMIGNSTVMMQNGIFADIAALDYIDLDMPYYLSGMMENVAIDNRLYFISGDASLGYLKCTYCLYFNRKLADDYNIENIYELVDNGRWTVDKVAEIARTVCSDLNGDGKYDLEDTLGFVFHDTNHPKGFITSCDASMFEKDSGGTWHYVFGSERDAGICDALYRLKNETEGVFYCNTTDAVRGEGYDDLTAKFVAGGILMITSEMDDINSRFRAIEDPYGILPYPKYNEEQQSYYNCSRNTQNAFSMPVTCQETGAAAAVLEALSCANYNSVLPAYFETAMKVKYATDSDSARMYDLIRDSTVLTFWYTYNNAIGSPEGVFFECSFNAKSAGQITSVVAARKSKIDSALAAYMEAIEAIAG
ncbi:MAG: hypothetical protein PHZ09_13485 [Eubacteriales bacterium]|nr:hypothetical protein [Eubacteriales bacterium]